MGLPTTITNRWKMKLPSEGIMELLTKHFKTTNPIEEVLNFTEDDVDIISKNSDISCLNTRSSLVDEENEAAPSLNNNTQCFRVTLKFYFSL